MGKSVQGSTKNSPVCKSFEINYTPYPAPIMPGSRTTVKRNVNDETFGNSLSDISVAAFQKRINSDALIISGDGGEIHAHQVVLAKSETLKYAMKSSDVRFQPEAVIIFPEFKKKSLVMMLQFLYTGEVDLISASELLVEFQELCKVLKLNPQVRKTKYVDGTVVPGFGKFSCVDCPATFDKAPKLIFHQQHCGKIPLSNVKAPVSSTDSKESSVAEKSDFTTIKQGTFQPKPVIEKAIVQDDFVRNNDIHEKSNDATVNSQADIFGASCSSSFRMPDNFDLPDEIIQEQLPAAKFYTSTPIRYGGTGSGITEKDKVETAPSEILKKSTTSKEKVKTETDPSEILRKSTASKEAAAKERSSLKKESLNRPQPFVKQERISEKQQEGHLKSKTVLPVAEDLAEKRKRLMLKLRYDEDDIIDEKMRKQEKKGKKPFKDKLQPSSSLAAATASRTQTTSNKTKSEKTGRKRRHGSSSSDDAEYDDSETSYDSDEDMEIKDRNFKSNKSSVKRLLPSNKLSVVVHNDGKERIMEFFEYKLKLQFNENEENQSEAADDDDDEVTFKATAKKKKTLKLEKVGKRTKRIVSGDTTSDDSLDLHTKKEPIKPPQVQPRSKSPEKTREPIKSAQIQPGSKSPEKTREPIKSTQNQPGSKSPEKSFTATLAGPSSPNIAKLPRIPKIQREPKTILPASDSATSSSEAVSPKPGPSKLCDLTGRTMAAPHSAPPQFSASPPPWPMHSRPISAATEKSFNEKRQMNEYI